MPPSKKRKWYAVRKGFVTGIFDNWSDCEKQVKGFRNAEFKSFDSEAAANSYLNERQLSKPIKIVTNVPPAVSISSHFTSSSLRAPAIPSTLSLPQTRKAAIKLESNEDNVDLQAYPPPPWITSEKVNFLPEVAASSSAGSDSLSSIHASGIPISSLSNPYSLFTDGAARHNPGPAGCGCVIYLPAPANSSPYLTYCHYLGPKETNNVAEYGALVRGLTIAHVIGIRHLRVRVDSKLLVGQVKQNWKVNKSHLQIYQIPREQNTVADQLSNQAIDGREKNSIHVNGKKIIDFPASFGSSNNQETESSEEEKQPQLEESDSVHDDRIEEENGEWYCPRCRNINPFTYFQCIRCHTLKPSTGERVENFERGKRRKLGEKIKQEGKDED